MGGALRETAREAGGLALRTMQVLRALWPALLGLLLIGWVVNHGSVLIAAALVPLQPYLVIPVLAVGAVGQLATILFGLRLVGSHLAVPELIKNTSGIDAATEGTERFSAVLGVTMLPFLGIYAAFGFVDRFVTEVVILTSVRNGLGSLVNDLNPIDSPTSILVVVVSVVVLYLVRRGLDLVQERSGRAELGVLGALVEASLLFVILLSGFRVLEQVGLWWNDRQLAAWFEMPWRWLADTFAIDLPAILVDIAEVVWPVLWEVVTQPLAWLTMAALAFGSKVISLADLWRGSGPTRVAEPATVGSRGGTRRAVLEAQAAIFGDLDDKYLPTWQSIRLILRAGMPFLGAYILGFSLVQLAGVAITRGLDTLVGGQQVEVWVALLPFLDLVPSVLVMVAQVALLGAAFSRMLERFAEGPSTPTPPGRIWRGLVVGVICVGLASLSLLVSENDDPVVTGRIGEPARLMGSTVTLGTPVLGSGFRSVSGELGATDLLVALPVQLFGERTSAVSVTAVSGERRYRPWVSGDLVVRNRAGFEQGGWVYFEVLPEDLEQLTFRVAPFELGISGRMTVLEVPAELDLSGTPGLVVASYQREERAR